MYHHQEDKDATICPELSGDKRAAGNSAFQKQKDEQVVQIGLVFFFSFFEGALEEGRAGCADCFCFFLGGYLTFVRDVWLFFFLQN